MHSPNTARDLPLRDCGGANLNPDEVEPEHLFRCSCRHECPYPGRTLMPLVCPHCHGNAFLMVTGSDGRAVTVCTECDNPVPFDPPTLEIIKRTED